MNVTDIRTEFGAYFLNSGQGPNDLAKLLNHPAATEELFTEIRTENTIIRRGLSSLTRLLQPYQNTWSPTGEVTWTAREIQLHGIKVDFQDVPDQLVESWLGFLASQSTDRKTWPFSRWLAREIALKQSEDFELNEIFAGVQAAPVTAGTAGLAGTAVNGIRKVINDHITAGDIVPITTGAPNANDVTFVGQVEAFVDAIDYRYRPQNMTIAMSLNNAVKYRRGMREKYNMNYGQANDLMAIINYPGITVKGYRSFGNSNKMFCTPRANAIMGKKNVGRNVTIESIDRTIKLFWDEHRGLGFVIPQIVFTNDQDLV